MASQQQGGRLPRWRLQCLFDGGHGVDQGGARRGVETAEQRRDLVMRSVVEFGKRRATPRRQGEFGDAAVGLRGLARHDLAPLQRPQGAAEKSGVEAERADQVGGGMAVALRDLVDDPRFLQRPGTVQELRFDDAELAGIEPAEAANGGNLSFQRIRRVCLISSNDYLTKSSILQAGHATMMRLCSRVREERPSCRSSRASERRPSGA